MRTDDVNRHARILIIDDEFANIRFLEINLKRAGYTHIHSTTDPVQSLELFRSIKPDIILLDLAMPDLDGFAVMKLLREQEPTSTVPILVLTADAVTATKHRALQAGAMDFLTKPLDQTEVLLRIHNLLERHFHSVLLESRVRERTQELEKAQLETLQRLALAAEYRDDNTGFHTRRIGLLAGAIARLLGFSPERVETIIRVAPLHDVGKIGISDTILLKPGKLTDKEFAVVRRHAEIGARILSGSTSPWLQMAEEIALNHHERWDGRGYPRGLSGEDIPLVGRIVAVADVFDALTHDRPYQRAYDVEAAVAEIEAQSGGQFDKRVVDAFLMLPHESFI
jgi:putative two-component system response regulator